MRSAAGERLDSEQVQHQEKLLSLLQKHGAKPDFYMITYLQRLLIRSTSAAEAQYRATLQRMLHVLQSAISAE